MELKAPMTYSDAFDALSSWANPYNGIERNSGLPWNIGVRVDANPYNGIESFLQLFLDGKGIA
jgi:hypothetical protein